MPGSSRPNRMALRAVRPCAGAALLLALASGCPPAAPPPVEPGYDPTASAPEGSTQQDAELAAAKSKIVPYDVEHGTTVYAIRDLLGALPRITNRRQRGEAQFLAAAATLDLALYADLTGDDRPLGGLRDAWGADGRDGTVARVLAMLDGIGGTFLPLAEQNARIVAGALRTADHAANLDAPALNGIVLDEGPLAFAARLLLLGAHAELLARVASAGPTAVLEAAPNLAEGLPEPTGELAAGLDPAAKSAVALLLFAAANAAAVQRASAAEPLATLLAPWLAAHRLDLAPLSFVRPLTMADLPESGARVPAVPFAGRTPMARLFVYLGASELAVGLSSEVRVADGALDQVPSPLAPDGDGRVACPIPDPLPVPPRRLACLQSAFASAATAAGGRLLIVGEGNVTLPVLVAVLREAAASGLGVLELSAAGPDGTLQSFDVEVSENRDLLNTSPAAVRVAQGGFYVGKRGDLVQVPRASGSHDYAGLNRTVEGREPPFVLAPADGTPYSTVLGAVSALAAAASAAGAVTTLVPPG